MVAIQLLIKPLIIKKCQYIDINVIQLKIIWKLRIIRKFPQFFA